MFTRTIVPKSATVTIQLPESYVGEEVRVIAVVEKKENEIASKSDKVEIISKKYSAYRRVNMSDFSFNRDEANDFG